MKKVVVFVLAAVLASGYCVRTAVAQETQEKTPAAKEGRWRGVIARWDKEKSVMDVQKGNAVRYSIINSTGDVAGVNSDFGQTGNRLQGCNVSGGPRNVAEWFNTSCFVNATQGTFGNAGRNSVWGPGNSNWDFALFKNGKITERFNYQFRAEFFNFLNHPSFGCGGCVGNQIGAGNYGQITGANDPREIQFGFKLNF